MGRASRTKWERRLEWSYERYEKLRKAMPEICWLVARRCRESVEGWARLITADLFK